MRLKEKFVLWLRRYIFLFLLFPSFVNAAPDRSIIDWCNSFYQLSDAQKLTVSYIWASACYFETEALKKGGERKILTEYPPAIKPESFSKQCAAVAAFAQKSDFFLHIGIRQLAQNECDLEPVLSLKTIKKLMFNCLQQDYGLHPLHSGRPREHHAGEEFPPGEFPAPYPYMTCGVYAPSDTEKRFTDLSRNMPELVDLELHACPGVDLAEIAKMPNLTSLGLSGSRLKDVSPLAPLVGLQKLNLSENYIEDISPLMSLVNLDYLDISTNNKISDLWAVRYMVNLSQLYLTHGKISDIRPVSNLAWMEVLEMGDNQLSDISPLGNLNRLRWIGLEDNKISDPSVLKSLPKLKDKSSRVFLFGNEKLYPAKFMELAEAGVQVR